MYSQDRSYAHNEAIRQGRHSSKVAQNYREKYLALRKTMREFSKATGFEFPEDIKTQLGMK